MKCIRYKKTQTITRVSNEIAQNEVDLGFAEYVPKHIWKKEIRDTIVNTPEEKPKRRHNKKSGKQKMIEGNA